MKIIDINAIFNTNGKGLYSGSVKQVNVKNLEIIPTLDNDLESTNDCKFAAFGEAKVYFDTNSWSVKDDGLIYTDPNFLDDLKKYLLSKGFDSKAINSIDYSIEEFQGNDFVSFDIERPFFKASLV